MKILCLSGGGGKASIQSGIIKSLVLKHNKSWDLIFGASAGAINGAFLAQYPKDQIKEGALKLVELWSQITPNHIFKKQSKLDLVKSLFNNYIIDTTPLHQLIRNNINHQKLLTSDVNCIVSAVSLNTGKIHTVDKNDSNFIDYILASASYPGMVPIKINQEWMVDTGLIKTVHLSEALAYPGCEIDLILTSPEDDQIEIQDKFNLLTLMKRCIDIMVDQVLPRDLEILKCRDNYPNLKINLYRPDRKLLNNILDFENEKINLLIQLGESLVK